MNINRCRLCGSSEYLPLFNKYGYSIVKCLQCSFIYTNQKVDPKFVKKFYTKDYFSNGHKKRGYNDYGSESLALQTTFRKRLTRLNLNQNGRVLDLGCAYGYFLQTVPNQWKKYGIEVDKDVSAIARHNNPTASIINGFFTRTTFKFNFDLICLWDVIEHLDDPVGILKTCYQKLKPGGQLALSTGDVTSLFCRLQGQDWHLFNPPQHLGYFSPLTISSALNQAGFKKIKISYPAAYYPISYLIYKLQNLYSISLLKPSRFEHLVVPVNLWDIMEVIAVK